MIGTPLASVGPAMESGARLFYAEYNQKQVESFLNWLNSEKSVWLSLYQGWTVRITASLSAGTVLDAVSIPSLLHHESANQEWLFINAQTGEKRVQLPTVPQSLNRVVLNWSVHAPQVFHPHFDLQIKIPNQQFCTLELYQLLPHHAFFDVYQLRRVLGRLQNGPWPVGRVFGRVELEASSGASTAEQQLMALAFHLTEDQKHSDGSYHLQIPFHMRYQPAVLTSSEKASSALRFFPVQLDPPHVFLTCDKKKYLSQNARIRFDFGHRWPDVDVYTAQDGLDSIFGFPHSKRVSIRVNATNTPSIYVPFVTMDKQTFVMEELVTYSITTLFSLITIWILTKNWWNDLVRNSTKFKKQHQKSSTFIQCLELIYNYLE